MSDEIVVVCPKCGSDDLREKNTAYAELRVLGWERDESSGGVIPSDYDTDVSVDWEVQDVSHQYVCAFCDAAWALDDLKPVASPTAVPQEGA